MSKYNSLTTRIVQSKCRIVKPEEWRIEGSYESNKPGDKWELIEYDDKKKTRTWTPKYTLLIPKIEDHSKVKIITID